LAIQPGRCLSQRIVPMHGGEDQDDDAESHYAAQGSARSNHKRFDMGVQESAWSPIARSGMP
jgi:hypothetical protein